jgi:hypothetical protein
MAELSDIIDGIKDIVKNVKPLIESVADIKSKDGASIFPLEAGNLYFASLKKISDVKSLKGESDFSKNHHYYTSNTKRIQKELYEIAKKAKETIKKDHKMYSYLQGALKSFTEEKMAYLLEIPKSKQSNISTVRQDFIGKYEYFSENTFNLNGEILLEDKNKIDALNVMFAACVIESIAAEKTYNLGIVSEKNK